MTVERSMVRFEVTELDHTRLGSTSRRRLPHSYETNIGEPPLSLTACDMPIWANDSFAHFLFRVLRILKMTPIASVTPPEPFHAIVGHTGRRRGAQGVESWWWAGRGSGLAVREEGQLNSVGCCVSALLVDVCTAARRVYVGSGRRSTGRRPQS